MTLPGFRRSRSLGIGLIALACLVAASGLSLTAQQTPDLFRSVSFREIGPTRQGGRFVDFAVVESTPRIFYAANASGGLWKTETVTVEANALAVKTIGSDVSGLVTGEQARELPLNGRNFMQLTQLMPGVTLQEGRNTTDKGLQGGSDVSVSGGSTTSNMWTVDGANRNDARA